MCLLIEAQADLSLTVEGKLNDSWFAGMTALAAAKDNKKFDLVDILTLYSHN